MTVKAHMPVHRNLVAPLAHEATDTQIPDTAAPAQDRSVAAAQLIGDSLRPSGHLSATLTPGTATSTTATRTTTTRTTKALPWPSAESDLFDLLVHAYLDCRRTKRNSASALAFEAHLERNLFELHEVLASGEYVPGRSICFAITRPKPREVWAAAFRDRIVHWLLYNHVAPRFHASFVADSCACIPGRGTLYAARRLEHQVRSATANWTRPAHYLKCDLANFFVSIDKAVLLAQLQRRIHEPWWMRLATTILMNDPRDNAVVRGSARDLARVPAHKSLFNAPPGRGLPIGNLSSQFFANVLLDSLDQFVKHRLRAPHYARYVDDFILLHQSPQWLNDAKVRIVRRARRSWPAASPRTCQRGRASDPPQSIGSSSAARAAPARGRCTPTGRGRFGISVRLRACRSCTSKTARGRSLRSRTATTTATWRPTTRSGWMSMVERQSHQAVG